MPFDLNRPATTLSCLISAQQRRQSPLHRHFISISVIRKTRREELFVGNRAVADNKTISFPIRDRTEIVAFLLRLTGNWPQNENMHKR
jgi:hypothetical protein